MLRVASGDRIEQHAAARGAKPAFAANAVWAVGLAASMLVNAVFCGVPGSTAAAAATQTT